MKNIVHLKDCMKFMKGLPDNAFDLAIVDPPYGINITKSNRLAISKGMGGKDWDYRPGAEYFRQIFKISKNQIIWGANYFLDHLPSSRGMIAWDKKNDGRDFADFELAFTSIDSVGRIFRMRPMNMDGGKIHPTQKPIALYKWILQNYAKPGQTIFDSHVGSGSIRIACHDLGFSFEGCEIDQDYWRAQEERFNRHKSQGQLFDNTELTRDEYTQRELIE